MSVAEVIKQIESMPPEEQRKVFAYFREHAIETVPSSNDAGGVNDDFKASADEIFTKNSELFRKLAQ